MNRIEVWLRIRDRARFSKDANLAARNIREIGEAARDSEGHTTSFGGALSAFGITARTTGRGASAFSSVLGGIGTIAASTIPLIIGLGGAITALAGSLGAATVGAGLFAGALGGVLAAGLGAVGLAGADLASKAGNINTAFQAWQDAVASFGRDSTQAETAFKRLTGAIDQNGGPAVYGLVRAFDELRSTFSDAMAPVTEKLTGFLTDLMGTLSGFMPLLARLTGVAVDALIPVFEKWVDVISSPEIATGLGAIFDSFSDLVGPIGQGVSNLFLGLFRLVVRMLPFLQPVADGFALITEQLANWAASGDLSPFIDQFKSWFGLLKAAGGLLVTVLGGGAEQGRGLVDSLTTIINKWNAWLQTAEGNDALQSFFKDAIDLTKAFAGFVGVVSTVVFRVGRAAMPLFTKAFGIATGAIEGFLESIKPAQPFFQNVLVPLISGLAKGIGGSLTGALNVVHGALKLVFTALGWLGQKAADNRGTLEKLGQIIGFLAGGPILKLLGALGKGKLVLGIFGAASRALYAPIRLVGSAFDFILRKAGAVVDALLGWGPKFAKAAWALGTAFGGALTQALGTGIGFAGDLAKSVEHGVARLLNSAIPDHIGPINLPNNPIPMLAAGGVVSGQGSWITGEAGPELNTLRGGRVTVEPLPAVNIQSTSATLEPGGGRRVLVSKVYLRGRQIAEAVADEAEDDAARR